MELNKYIDHTLLKPDATPDDIRRLCREADKFGFAAVVVNPANMVLAKEYLKSSEIFICSVAGFPLGASLTATKVNEALSLVDLGVDEIDVVANIGWLRAGQFDKAIQELNDIREILPPQVILKVIIETPLLPREIRPLAVEAVVAAGADYVKSATGFFGATPVEHIRELNRLVSNRIKIKAAGGIKTAAQALAMIEAGAARLGCSSSVAVMEDFFKTGEM